MQLTAAIHLNFTNRLKGVAGASAVRLKTTGDSYGSDLARDDHKVSPYAGLLFDLTRNLTLYASYTDIYSPQAQVNIDNSRLTPAKGTSIEGWTTALPRRRRYSRPSSAASPAMSALSMELTAP